MKCVVVVPNTSNIGTVLFESSSATSNFGSFNKYKYSGSFDKPETMGTTPIASTAEAVYSDNTKNFTLYFVETTATNGLEDSEKLKLTLTKSTAANKEITIDTTFRSGTGHTMFN